MLHIRVILEEVSQKAVCGGECGPRSREVYKV